MCQGFLSELPAWPRLPSNVTALWCPAVKNDYIPSRRRRQLKKIVCSLSTFCSESATWTCPLLAPSACSMALSIVPICCNLLREAGPPASRGTPWDRFSYSPWPGPRIEAISLSLMGSLLDVALSFVWTAWHHLI